MTEASMKFLATVAIVLFPMTSFGAGAGKFKHMRSVYSDDKGGSIKHPEGVACNERSLFIVADTGNGRLLRFTFRDGTLGDRAEIKVPQLSIPLRVQINSKGEIYALDGKRRRIIRLSPEGEFKSYIEPRGLPSPGSWIPRGLTIDKKDNIYILDVFSGRVLVLNPEGRYQKQVTFPEDYGFFSDLSVDLKGTIFLIDSTRAMVFHATKGSDSFSPLTKSLKEYMSFPTSLAVDSRGKIYIVDQNGSGVVILGQDGSFQGRRLSMGWKEGLLYYPSQLCINEKGEIFIADRNNNRIQIFTVVQ
jgi:sugar lactone lactonase YvrE